MSVFPTSVLRAVIHAVVVASILAGLLPPPLVAELANTILPESAANVATQTAQALLPPIKAAQASMLAAPPAAPVSALLAQAVVTGTSSLTITKNVIGSTQNNFEVTLTGPSYPSGAQIPITSGTQVITGLVNGVYTITETSPGVGWTTVYTASGVSSSTNAVVTLTNVITAAATAVGQITGVVYNDYNSNGVRDTTGTSPNYAVDGGVAGVVVTAYDRNSAVAGTATADANGLYTLTTTASGLTGPYRLEFSNLPSGYEPSRTGTGNATSTQFASAGATNVNFGVALPANYCQNNPLLCTPTAINGDASTTADAIYAVRYDGTNATVAAKQNQIGATWGIAYKRNTKQVFASAYVQRHLGLGSLGLGGIYTVTGAGTASPQAGPFVDLENAPYNFNFGTLGNNTVRGLPANVTTPNRDPLAFAAVGKQGIGDLDISEDGNSLWAVNLYTATSNLASLIKLDVTNGSAGAATQYPLALMSGLPTCTGGIIRPWALKFAFGKGYLGAVCSAETTQVANNLVAYVMSFDPAAPTAVSIELTIPLTYTKGEANSGTGTWTPAIDGKWYPWLDTYSAAAYNGIGGALLFGGNVIASTTINRSTPILEDIEFDNQGGMTLGFGDRAAMQIGAANYEPTANNFLVYQGGGDILRACKNATGIYILEKGGSCGGANGFSTNNNKGPGGGEWYNDNAVCCANHEEVVYGGLAQLPGATDAAWGGFDPSANFDTGGLYWNSILNGSRSRSTQLWIGLTAADDSGGTPVNGHGGKANGQGDVELLCDLAPIEIGNGVWNDVNNNGVQDPGEPALAGVVVSLQTISGTITTTTNISGTYIFTREATTGLYTQTLRPNTNYTITINPSQTVLNGYSLTLADQQAISGSTTSNDAILDTRDSDAYLVSNLPTIFYTTGSAGQNNHGLDVGFSKPASAAVTITNTAPAITQSFGNRLWLESDNDGNAATDVIGSVANHVLTATAANNTVYITTTDSNGFYTFTVPAGVYAVTFGLPPVGYQPSNMPGGSAVNAASGGNDTSHNNDTVVTLNAGEVITTVDFGFTPIPASLQIVKVVTGGASSDPFTVTVTGPNGYNVITTVTSNVARLLTNLESGNYTVQETTLPTAPTGFAWSGTIYTPTNGDITLSAGATGIVTITNQLAVIPPNPASLRIIKEITGGASNASFTVTVTGPDSFNQVTTVTPGTPTVLNNLTAGAYTVVESALPGASSGFVWSGTIYTPTGGVVNLTAGATDTVTITNQLAPQSLSLGNLVWIDAMRDGIFTPANNETGVAGVTVTLHLSVTASPIMTTTTDAGGHYTFTSLNPGDYVVKIPATNFASGAPLAGYLNTTTPVSAADINGNTDSDNDGVTTSALITNGVTSLAIRLDFNNEPDDEGDDPPGGDDNTNYTVDFGFAETMADLHLTKTGSTTSVKAGDLLTYTITLTNDGPDTATNVIVLDLLPTTVTYLTHTQSVGVYANLSGDWAITSLPIGSATLTMTVQVK